MRRRVLAGGLLLLLAGCSVVLGLDPPTYDGPLATPDASTEAEAPIEAGTPLVPGKLDDPARWATYDGPGGGYMVGPFDGHFVYFVRAADQDGPDAGLTGSRILRYDTRSESFNDPKAWMAFDPEVALVTKGPHAAAVMEGKYLVVASFADNVFLRYDTTRPDLDFGFSSSWERYEATKLPGVQTGYTAAVPLPDDAGSMFNNGTTYSPLLHHGESLDAGWEGTAFDGGTFPGGCGATYNGLCVGNHVFFTPGGSSATACLARFDPSKPLRNGFESFDVASLGEESVFLAGGVASPQHVYLTQYNTKDAAAPTQVLRKPIDGALDAGWERQPTNTKNPLARGFVGGAYDGRFMYFAPYPMPTPTVIFQRYDTQLGFNDSNAWDVAAGAALGIPANRYWGAVFDGQYVYYSPYQAPGAEKPAFVRFKAWDTPIAVPPACR